MLTVHGRTREQRGPHTGLANWEAIRVVCQSVDVPVIANGNIQIFTDIERCLSETGAKAVMSAEGVLSNPLLFENKCEPNWVIGKEYLDYAERYKANISAIRAHLFRICHYSLLEYTDLREKMSYVCTIPEFCDILTEIQARVKQLSPDYSDPGESLENFDSGMGFESYISSLPHWICKPYLRPQRDDSTASTSDYRERRRAELEVIAEQTGLSKRQIRKREKRKIGYQKTKSRKQTYIKCLRCSMPASQGCKFLFCRNCCRYKSAHEKLDCKVSVLEI
ncbi:unnamed protein product [Enterobius vermicularis]|uniref:Dus domain-containing protein n=1 Tax=Enterobius vermicularis TaxID=51028 RepID=A0A0N4USU7_ENTVE|nr:unnamed protein product [Enterobius vermicularis]